MGPDAVVSVALFWGNLRDEVHEAGKWLIRLVPHVPKLNHHFLFELVVNDRDSERRSLVGQKAPIVGALQVELQVCKTGKGSKGWFSKCF